MVVKVRCIPPTARPIDDPRLYPIDMNARWMYVAHVEFEMWVPQRRPYGRAGYWAQGRISWSVPCAHPTMFRQAKP